jgi:hypothetical protein
MIQNNTIVNEDINASAAIAATKVQGTTPSGGSANQVLKKVDGTDYNTTWGTIAGAVYQASAPSSPQTGDVWVDSDAVAGVLNQNDYLLKADAEAPSGYLLKTNGFVRTSSASSGEASTVNINTKPWNMPWGVLGHVTTSPGQTITTVTDVTGVTVTFNAVSGRRYKTTLNLEFYNTVANSLTEIFLCDAANSPLRGWTVQIKDANLQTPYFLNWVESVLNGSVTRKLRMARGFGSSANIVTFSSQQITIEDIGPA